jgi:hypothetical protein
MSTIEETYCVVNKYTGRDHGLLVVSSTMDGRGAIAHEMQVLTLGDRPLEGGEYSLQFVKKLLVDPATRRRFAPMLVANSNQKGGRP